MTTALRSSHGAAHRTRAILSCHHATRRPAAPQHRRHGLIVISQQQSNHATSSPPPQTKKRPLAHPPAGTQDRKPNPPSSAADHGDGVNAPRSTLPPPLALPASGPDVSTPVYYFRLGRAFGKFYWAGVKATWANHKLARGLRARMRGANGDAAGTRLAGLLGPPLLVEVEVYCRRHGGGGGGGTTLDRGAFQLLAREAHDFGKLPLFALLVAAFGEWLPLIVPFIPGTVPRTCRIPRQIEGMRRAAEERRRAAFRAGVAGPDARAVAGIRARLERARAVARRGEREAEKLLKEDDEGEEELVVEMGADEGRDVVGVRTTPQIQLANMMTEILDREQLVHVSTSLGLHGRIWDRLGLTPYLAPFLVSRVSKRLQYLNLDDTLLLADRQKGHRELSFPELEIACEDRGIDVTGRPEKELRKDLARWFDGRQKDQGYGEQVFNMLFKRPNAWS